MGVALVLIFLTVALGITAGYHVLAGFLFPDSERIRRRLVDEFKRESTVVPQSTLFKNLEDLKFEAPVESGPVAKTPFNLIAHLRELLQQANLKLTPPQLLLIVAGISLVCGLAALWWLGPIFAIFAASVGCTLPIFFVYMRRNACREKLLNQLPNAFELMSRVLRAGHSVPQALQAVVDAFADPVAAEFASCQQQQNLGLRPEVTFQEMAERSGIVEMRIFVMAINIQRQTGGNLSQVLERLATVVRARLRLRKQVRTLTAEGRLQGWSLVVMPFIAFAAMMIVNREYAEVLLEHGAVLMFTGLAMLVGILWIRRIVNFDY